MKIAPFDRSHYNLSNEIHIISVFLLFKKFLRFLNLSNLPSKKKSSAFNGTFCRSADQRSCAFASTQILQLFNFPIRIQLLQPAIKMRTSKFKTDSKSTWEKIYLWGSGWISKFLPLTKFTCVKKKVSKKIGNAAHKSWFQTCHWTQMSLHIFKKTLRCKRNVSGCIDMEMEHSLVFEYWS